MKPEENVATPGCKICSSSWLKLCPCLMFLLSLGICVSNLMFLHRMQTRAVLWNQWEGTYDASWPGDTCPERNPMFEEHQDPTTCFPLGERWYMVYRNFENDPYFGGTAKCISVMDDGTYENNSALINVKFGNEEVNATMTHKSPDGYSVKSMMDFVVDEGKLILQAHVAYSDCDVCTIFRNTYIDGTSCSYFVPESQLDKDDSACHFIYGLLCGANPSYQIYDRSCKAK